jgi:hypothetical protein
MTSSEGANNRSYGAATNTWFSIEVVEGSVLSNTATLAPAGPQGPQGVTGAQGPQGPSGASVTGAQGPQGPTPLVYLQKNYNFVGNLTTGTGTARFYAPSNITLRSAYFTLGTPPTSVNSTISIIKNNSTTLNTINILASNYVSINTPMSASMTTSDFLTVTTAASSEAANGSLTIIYTYD